MRLLYLLGGFLVVFVGYILSGFAIPWIAFTPLPQITHIHPFRTIGAVFYAVGGILIVGGLTTNWAMRLLLWLLVIVGVWLWYNPSVLLYVGG